MPPTRERSAIVRDFILVNLTVHSSDIVSFAAEHFGVTRQSIARHLRFLLDQGLVHREGTTRNCTYSLIPLIREPFSLAVDALEEDSVWRERILPHLVDLPANVLNILDYGFTEMLNNVIDHSGSETVDIAFTRLARGTRIEINDRGVGIFKRIQTQLGLDDPRHALLELSKGKLTTDPASHTGEGIFFASRMFDEFCILSGEIGFFHSYGSDSWIIDAQPNSSIEGTLVSMEINDLASHTTQQVFDRFAPGDGDYTFSRTHVAINLARQEGENLVSRSQAKRILARIDHFEEAILDFAEIDSIGPSFADEIFRVFANQHPEIRLIPVNICPQVNRAIQRVKQNQMKGI